MEHFFRCTYVINNSDAQMDSSWMFEGESTAECACRGAAVFECDEMRTMHENVNLAEMVRSAYKKLIN